MGISKHILTALKNNEPWLIEWNFSNKGLTDNDLTELSEALKNNTHFKKINLEQNKFTDDGVKLLAKTALTDMNLSNNAISNIGIQAIALSSSLRSLGLSHTKEPLNQISAATLAQNTSLKELDLSQGGTLSKETMEQLAATQTLKKLNLSNSYFSNKEFLAHALAKNSSITHLDVSNCYLSNKFCTLISKNKTITHLSLYNNNKIDDKGVIEFAHHMKQLNSLNLASIPISDESIIPLSKKLKNLTTLNLASTKIGIWGVCDLAHNKTITNLNLSFNKLQDKDVCFFEDNKQLTHLNVSWNCISDLSFAKMQGLLELDASHNQIEEKGCSVIADHKTIQKLSVSHNPLSLDAICEFAQNKSLRSLDMSGFMNGSHHLGNAAAKVIVKNVYIEDLNIADQSLSTEGISALAQSTSLKNLNLHCNLIDIEAVQALSENTSIRSLDVTSNAINDTMIKILIKNQALRELNANFNYITEHLTQYIINTKNNISHYHFKNNRIDIDGQVQLAQIPGLSSIELDGYSSNSFLIESRKKELLLKEQLDIVELRRLENDYQQKNRFKPSTSKQGLFSTDKIIIDEDYLPDNSRYGLFK